MADEMLKDVESIVVSRPELTPEEWDVVARAKDWLKATLRPEVRQELDADYAKQNDEFQEKLRTDTIKVVEERMEEWKKAQKPLDKDDLTQLLSKEYLEFPVPIKARSNGEVTAMNFTIVELPIEAEDKFMKVMQGTLVKLMEKINAAEWKLDGSLAEKIQGVLDNFPDAMVAAVDLVVICLDPWGENELITSKWVRKSLSSYRIACILIAQVEANKYRDFFSNGFRLSRSQS